MLSFSSPSRRRIDAPVGEDGLDAEELTAGRAVAQDVDAAGVGRDGAADGRGVAGREIDAVVPARGARVLLRAARWSRRPAR